MNSPPGPLEDLEAMLDRSLKIDSTPPRWQSPYSVYASNASPSGSSPEQPGQPGQTAQSVSQLRKPMRSPIPPPKIPMRDSQHGPQAVYHHNQAETSAVPNATATRSTSAPRGLRLSPTHQSLGAPVDQWEQRRREAAAEQQRLEQIRQNEALQQERFEQQHREHLLRLTQEQQEQEHVLERLRQAEIKRQHQQQQQEQLQLQLQHQQHQQQQREQRDLLLEQQREQQREQQQVDADARMAAELAEQDELAQHEEARAREAAAEAAQQEADRQMREAQERQRQRDLELQRRVSVQRVSQHEQLAAVQNRAREQRLEQEVGNDEQDAAYRRDGAATMVQHVQDNQGNVTTRVVKKGVEDFEFKDELGTGSYSTVLAAQDKQTLRKYAIKVLDKMHIIKEQKVKYVEIEKHTLNRLGDHPGIIHLYFTFQDRQSLYFVLDFAPNGELLHLIKRIGSLNEAGARYYAAQLLDAIDYMHKRGVIHRDLKPENILLDYKLRIKITDFGTAKLLEPDPTTGEYPRDIRANSFVGTAEYVSPELLLDKAQGKSTDIWAWGCVLYQMIAASPPFQGNTQFLTFQKIARLHYAVPPGFPYLVRDLLKHVLVKPSARWTVQDIKQHEFFEGQDWSRKALWSNGPPKLQPYRASVESMKPRSTSRSAAARSPPARAAADPHPRPRPTAPRPSQPQSFVPTAAGLQPVKPTTLYGMPVSQSTPDVSQTASRIAARPRPRAAARPNQSATAASAALYRTPQPQPTSSYQQRQNRITEITRRVQDRSRGESIIPPSSPQLSSSPSLPASPSSPSVREILPQPPLTQLESQWAGILISAQERILRLGHLNVFVSTHMPPQTAPEKPDEESENKVVTYSYGDDSLISKIFTNSKQRPRVVIITTTGRLLIIGDDRKIRIEVPLGVPQVSISEVPFQGADGESATKLVIQTYNRVLTLDDPDKNIEPWMDTIDLSRRYYAQLTADQERNSHNAAAAAAMAVSGLRKR